MQKWTDSQLAALNTLTKYPSISTYHPLGEKGRLLPDPNPLPAGQALYVTEKIDGTNVRILLLEDGSVILGSREQLLWRNGDFFGDPAQGIVAGLRLVAEHILSLFQGSHLSHVLYGEFYGGKVTAASKQYTGDPSIHGFRLFDVQTLPSFSYLQLPLEKLAAWREGNNQDWLKIEALYNLADRLHLPVVPDLVVTDADLFPKGLEETAAWLEELLPYSCALLDQQGGGQVEGIVVRTADRKTIFKVRCEDYKRTLKARQ